MNWTNLLLEVGVAIVALFAAYQLNLILHEAGHLLMGKLSGYSFVSFRVYHIMFAKENGKLMRKNYNVVGTAGQALMSPPEMKNGAFPTVLYNLGGCLMDFLLGALFVWLSWRLSGLWAIAFSLGAAVSILMGLLNVIPLKVGGVPNDGYNLFLLGRKGNAAMRHAFWVQLRANALQTSGVRPRDFPSAWFEWVTPDLINDPMVAPVAVLHYACLLDKLELDKARDLAVSILDTADKMLDVHKNELRCELLFHELIGECRAEALDRLYTQALKDYIHATAAYIARQRLLYAYARLFLQDSAKAEAHLALFRKSCETSASLGEIPGEEALVALVDRIAGLKGA